MGAVIRASCPTGEAQNLANLNAVEAKEALIGIAARSSREVGVGGLCSEVVFMTQPFDAQASE